ncbi:MAG TPA: hypothetical protein VNM22_16430 [Candidatus Limnocylindrales bacterium]|nr:hypothetical protein [Candidatus Limnocylindrales bacterium]
MSNNIEGKVVVITGASSGLGEVAVRFLSTQGTILMTVISPGAVAMELPKGMTEPDVAKKVRKAYEIAIPAESFTRAVAFAISQPEDMGVNEILFWSTQQEL